MAGQGRAGQVPTEAFPERRKRESYFAVRWHTVAPHSLTVSPSTAVLGQRPGSSTQFTHTHTQCHLGPAQQHNLPVSVDADSSGNQSHWPSHSITLELHSRDSLNQGNDWRLNLQKINLSLILFNYFVMTTDDGLENPSNSPKINNSTQKRTLGT